MDASGSACAIRVTVTSDAACLSVASNVFERDEMNVHSESALDCDLTGGVKTSSAGLSPRVGETQWLSPSGMGSHEVSSFCEVITRELAAKVISEVY